jgi:glycosyltransferase involved in cell wall biosynthesis
MEAPTELVVIIPARNEEAALPACLASILPQSEPGFELGMRWRLIVVDDASTDGTRALAEANAGVTVIEAPKLESNSGFHGKTNACWAGAQYAIANFQPTWLLFTDADTIHAANSLSRAMREAEKHEAAMLSYSPRQITTGFWQAAVTPLIFSELASVYPPQKVSDPGDRLAAANGQFILIDREAYTAIGGHRAVGPEILEDVALARNLKRSQRRLRFRYAPEMVAARMYRDTASLIEGWSKNLVLLFPAPVALIFWRIVDLLLFFGLPALALGLPFLAMWQREVIGVLWVRTVFRFYNRVARAHGGFQGTVISIFGVPFFIFLLMRSLQVHRMSKQVGWKGRIYPAG